MQSTGHSSMHGLSSTSTQVCAMMYVTGGLLSSFWSLLLSQYGGSVAGAASACDNTSAGWFFLGSVSLPAHIAIRRSPVITGIPHFADPVVLGVRNQPAGYRPGPGPLDVHDRDASVSIMARTVRGDPDQDRLSPQRPERLGQSPHRAGQVRLRRRDVPA